MRSASGTYERRGCLKLGSEANVMRKQHGRRIIRDTTHRNDTQGERFLDINGMTFHSKTWDISMMAKTTRRKIREWRCRLQNARKDFRNTKHADS
jgi:hypothetical protein